MRILISESILLEGYQEIEEFRGITTEILQWYAQENAFLVNKLLEAPVTPDSIRFEEDVFHSGQLTGKYPKMAQWLDKRGLLVLFVVNITPKGFYSQSTKTIKIKNDAKGFINDMELMQQDIRGMGDYIVSNGINGGFTTEDSTKLLLKVLRDTFSRTLMHELQHAYDDYRTNSKYIEDKKSNTYYDRLEKNKKLKIDRTPYDHQIYLTLPHEYWARFTETVPAISMNKEFGVIKNEFTKRIGGWKLLGLNHQKRLLKALWLYYQEKNTNTT